MTEEQSFEDDGKTYHLVGCRKCDTAENWVIGYREETVKPDPDSDERPTLDSDLIAKCVGCGHIVFLSEPTEIIDKPDSRPIPLRIFL